MNSKTVIFKHVQSSPNMAAKLINENNIDLEILQNPVANLGTKQY